MQSHKSHFTWRPIHQYLMICITLCALGCNTNRNTPPETQPQHHAPKYTLDTFSSSKEVHVIDAYDPWESVNRKIYKFNAQFDRNIFLPTVNAYRKLCSKETRQGVYHFFSNLEDINNLANALLQGKLETSWITTQRIAINTTFGILGIYDSAADDHRLFRQHQDFGQTLAHYGITPGPYMILPLLGPSTLRDSTGQVADYLILKAIDPILLNKQDLKVLVPVHTLNAIATRDKIDVEYYQTQSPFEYDMLRFMFLKKRSEETKKPTAAVN